MTGTPEAPEAETPEAQAPEATAPQPVAAEAETPGTTDPETSAEAPEPAVSETVAPETVAPETGGAEAAPPEPASSESAAVGPKAAAVGEGERDRPRGVKGRVAYWRGWRGRHPQAARAVRWGVTVLCLVLVLGALVLPNRLFSVHVSRFLRLPGEAIIGAAVLLVLPRRPRVALAALAGAALGALTVLNLLDMGFVEYLGRDFNLVLDWGLLDDAQSYVADSMGGTVAIAAAVGVVLLVVLVMVLMALATVRLSGLLASDTLRATRGTLVAGTAWITCSVLGLQFAGAPVASDQVAHTLASEAKRVRDTLRDEAAFGKVARSDTFGATPADQLVPDLRGKDMIFTFIESYGRSAIEDPVMAPGVDKTLDASTQALAKAGFHAKSGWLTSATYGGSSWLGHSTTLSGLWVDNQQRYRTVMASDHLSLTKAFQKTGAWDTVGVMPGVQKGWPEAKFYGLDKVYNAFQMGYQGPKFSWSTMPDQYALEAFQRLEHGRANRDKPLMGEIILTSSHQPWAPIPKMVGWDELGDGSVFDGIEKAGKKASDVIADSAKSKEEYGKSIQYSVTALTQWLERYGTDDTVLVFLGDHQPIARVSGDNASRDVPISVVAKDPKVLDKIAAWNWTDGLKPAHNAPVWKMDAFRDKFLTAYGSTPHPSNG
ncbi:CDP-alcohol phosphatidyltransferase [Streptomyces sp. NBC_01485]|uniref:CDP-alcohol phosphatidyltransferase n=1 Tax=Streptomyces sp. NBC_01485 TaxID=2903884 RepID=UPI002E352A5A|nr:CDP-alcohol phosphatidyltransferase [Streptomyces sp. NBC_01485]